MKTKCIKCNLESDEKDFEFVRIIFPEHKCYCIKCSAKKLVVDIIEEEACKLACSEVSILTGNRK